MDKKFVTSLELSKKLKAAGAPQESEWYWVWYEAEDADGEYEWCYPKEDKELKQKGGWVLEEGSMNDEKTDVSAFHVGELGEMLATRITTFFDGKLWICRYITDKKEFYLEGAYSEAEARGQMYLYLLEQKLIDPSSSKGTV